MSELILMVGLPRAGKTTKAKELSRLWGAAIVCPDAIRGGMFGDCYGGHAFVPDCEPLVWDLAQIMVKGYFRYGYEQVILDATNVTRERRDKWKSARWTRTFMVFETPVKECLRRAACDNRQDLLGVIRNMDQIFEPVGLDEGRVVLE